jgi:hypothetical protein
MAANNRKGFTPVRYLNGAPWSGQVSIYSVATNEGTAIGIGDLVKVNGTTVTAGDAGASMIGLRGVSKISATTDAVVGVMVGIKPYTEQGGSVSLDLPQYAAATLGKVRYVYVVDDPNVLFSCLEDADTTPLTLTGVGLNISPTVAAASTTTGQSASVLDSSTVSTTLTLPLKLMEFVNDPGNVNTGPGTVTSRWIVKLNNHSLSAGTGTVGV